MARIKNAYFFLGFVLALIPASSTRVFAQDAKPGLEQSLTAIRSSAPENYEALITEILSESTSAVDVANAIRAGVKAAPDEARKQNAVAGWSEWTATDENGVTRPYQIYMPDSVANGEAPVAVVVHLHGAVGKPEFGTGKGSPQATGYAGFIWPEIADAEKLLIVCPVGKDECSWWKDNGVAHVNAVIRDVRRTLDFPEESIFAAGFSDGGSGCYYRAMVAPDPFTGFIALNGHPRVAATASEKQIYLPNMSMSSTFAGMTQLDSLYPSKVVMPHILMALEHDADILAVSYPKMNHQPAYFKEQTPAVLNFIKNTKRSQRDHLRWYASNATIGKVGGLELLEFASPEKATEVGPFNVMSHPGRIRIGIQFAGGSNKVVRVVEGSVAAEMDVHVGDEMKSFDGEDIADSRGLRSELGKKQHGDRFVCVMSRDGEDKTIGGQFPEFVSKPVYLRENPTGFADCQFAEGDNPSIVLTTTNVTKLRIWLPESMASKNEIEVTHNGTKSLTTVSHLTSKELLENFANEASSFVVHRAYVDIEM